MFEVAIVGCGYVANMYRLTLAAHPDIRISGVYDLERSRSETFAKFTGAKLYHSMDDLVSDKAIKLVLNLTSPKSHYVVSRAILEAGKHVYTEKPIALDLDQAIELTELSEQLGLLFYSAPCTLFSPAARAVSRGISDGKIGQVRLVYAEMDDGMISEAPTSRWVNESGISWPVVSEFETGCTLEHAGYVFSWLCAFFGPALQITAHSEIIQPEKIEHISLPCTPDFSVATVRFSSGVVARVTNSIFASHNHTLRLFGDHGVITVNDPRSDDSKVHFRRYANFRRRRILLPWSKSIKSSERHGKIPAFKGSQRRDFWRGVEDMISVIRNLKKSEYGARFGLHVTELTLASHAGSSKYIGGRRFNVAPYTPITTFEIGKC